MAYSNQPKKLTEGDKSVEQHSLADQIEAEKFENAKKAGRKPLRGVSFVRTIPPGAI